MKEPFWEDRLAAVVAKAQAKPFAWGDNDCGTLALDVLAAVTDGKFQPPVVPARATAREGAAAVRKLRGKSMGDVLARHLEEVAPAMAQRGDLGTCGGGCVVCLGAMWFGLTEADGGLVVPLDRVERAFRT